MKTTTKTIFAVAACWLTAGVAVEAQNAPQWPEVTNEMKAGSRWWWMGSAVDRENLLWNMQQYAAAGLGTLEISPIYGVQGNSANNISYLSTRWLDMLSYVEEQGKQLGLDIDMINCTGWPFGGPMLKADETAAKLVTETTAVSGDGQTPVTITINSSKGTLQRILAYPKTADAGSYQDLTALADGTSATWTAPAGEWQVITVYCQHRVFAVKRPSPGSDGYALDHFDADAVAAYLAWYDKKFAAGNNPWPRSFFNDSYEINTGDWTRHMFEQFEHYRGYKLESCMDKLLAGDKQTLADYRQTLDDMLLHNFTEQWTAWAHSHGVTTRNQAHGSPGNLIDLYAAADIPEIESFYLTDFRLRGLRQDPGFTMTALSSPTTLKYASSAAHVTGKPLVSSESMTWLTEHFRASLSQMKPEVDQLFAAGVNHVMFHGTCYSPQQAAWPGWKFYAAVDMSPTNSIWRDAPSFFKYIERVQSFMQLGEPDNEILVYAPFVHNMYRNTGDFANRMVQFDINKMDQKMPEMVRCVTALTSAGYDCDYISDRLLLTTTFTDGRLTTSAGVAYRALVVPLTTDMPAAVKAHLEQLAEQGATIVYAYDEAALSQLGLEPEEMRQDGLSVVRRKHASGYHYFVANLTHDDRDDYYRLGVPFADVLLFDPLTGAINKAQTTAGGYVMVSLKSGQSVILVTYDSTVSGVDDCQPTREQRPVEIEGPWKLTFTADTWPDMSGRAYTLDRLQTWETLDEATACLMGTGIYETTFDVTAQQMKNARGGFRLSLGDVRESARVWVNDTYVGCAWSVPYEMDLGETVVEGTNTLRIEVTNLPANRIRKMDADGTVWRIFEDINMSNISTPTYEAWNLVPSGLNSHVELIALSDAATGLEQTALSMQPAADGLYYPCYELELGSGASISEVAATTLSGEPFEGFSATTTAEGTALVTVTGAAADGIVVTTTDAEGQTASTILAAYGPFRLTHDIDFTAETAPGGGWTKLASNGALSGFAGNGKLPWYRSTLNGTTVTGLYDGLTFESEKSNYYFYFPGYGMNTNNDFKLTLQPAEGSLVRLNFLMGDNDKETVYDAADSIVVYSECRHADEGLTLELKGNKSYFVYRSLQVYQPASDPVGLKAPVARWTDDATPYYNIQGQRVTRPRRGLYIHRGKKVIVK